MGSKQNNEQRLGALTALRFFAAILVVFGHTRHDFLPLSDFPEHLVFNQAVTFFFALSGFILTYVYPALPNFKATKAFFVKRVARLWPLHVSTFFLDKILVTPSLVTVGGTAPKFLVMVTNLAMLHAWVPFAQFFFSYNAPSWSISAEFFFYLCFPVLIMLMRKHFFLPAFLSLMSITFFVYICNVNHLTEDAAGWNMEGLLYINPMVRIFEFITGMMTARLFIHWRDAWSNRSINQHGGSEIRNVFVGTIAEVFAFAFAIACMFASVPTAEAALPYLGEGGAFWLKNSAVPLLSFNLLILITAFGRGLISRFLSLPPMVLLGDISYAVYLVHYPLLMYRRCFLPQENTLYSLIAFLAVLLILSHLLFVVVERPVRHLITTVLLNDNLSSMPPATAGEVTRKRTIAAFLGTTLVENTRNVLVGLFAQVRAFFQVPRKRALLLVELCCLTMMVLVLHPTLDRVKGQEVLKFLSIDKYLAKEISVGDDLVISRVISHRQDSSTEVELLFRAMKKQHLEYYLFVQLLDSKGEKFYEQQVNFSPLPTKVKAGDYFLQSIQLPIKEVRKAENIGVIVLKENHGFLPIAGGKTDMDQFRLLMSAKSLKRRTGEPML